MNGKPPRLRRTKPRFKPGDWVAYTSGLSRHVAEVVEHVGPVGSRRRHFYRLRESIWYGEPVEYELPESFLEPATYADMERRDPPDLHPIDPYSTPDPYHD